MRFFGGVLTGLGVAMVAFVIGTKFPPPILQQPVKPPILEAKANDHRIVRYSDGKFRIQYYWVYPGWSDMCWDYPDYERAKSTLDYIEAVRSKRFIMEVFPRKK